MNPKKSLFFFILFYTCFLTPPNGAKRLADCVDGSELYSSWRYYGGFIQEWFPKEEGSELKRAAKPSAIAKSLSFLEQTWDEHYRGDVWGLWDYGTDYRSFSYKFNYHDVYFPFETTLVTLQIKYYSSVPIHGRVWPCAMTNYDYHQPKGLCEFSSKDSNNDWMYVNLPVLVSEEGLGFEFNTIHGSTLIIDEVAFNYRTHPCHRPEPQEETQQNPEDERGTLDQILNQFKPNFTQAFNFITIFNNFGMTK